MGRLRLGALAPDQHDHGGPAMTGADPDAPGAPAPIRRQSLSIVIPVYRAGAALESTVREVLEVCADVSPTPGVRIALDELILVCDNPGLPVEALDHLAGLADLDERVRVVWLSRNFGQHPATVAGIVSTNGDWVVTMDEDGQHDPAFIRAMLATAGRNRTPLVYAEPTNTRPHGAMRNAASWVSGRVARSVSGVPVRFNSFRLLEGSLARSACAYAGENVFLDVSLSWTCGPPSACPVELRAGGRALGVQLPSAAQPLLADDRVERDAPVAVHRRRGCRDRPDRPGRGRVADRRADPWGDPRAGLDVGGHRAARAARRALRRGGGGRGVRGAGGAQHGRAAGVRPGRSARGPGAARAEPGLGAAEIDWAGPRWLRDALVGPGSPDPDAPAMRADRRGDGGPGQRLRGGPASAR